MKAIKKTRLQSYNKCNDHITTASDHTSTVLSKSKRKKKNMMRKAAKLKLQGDEDLQRTKQNKQVVDFEEELRLFKEEELEKERLKMDAEQRQKGEKMKRPDPEVVVFEDPSRRRKKQVVDQDSSKSNKEEFNLKKARYEVRQFGLSGFSFEDREKCEMDRAIRLGAWAPKRENINYKEFIAIQKKKKEEDRQQREIDRKMGYSVTKKPAAEKTRVRNQGFWRDPTQDKKFFLDGQVGRYKQGVQVVSRDDISRVKTKSKKGSRRGSGKNIKF
ncbi:uncharacterized protein C1orf131 homolog [Patiria miniata]|uniref:Uncharacterized protein n=1 Tax=Patiria miniata TaxID=46514 RepID=A0A913ZNC5_PATMI|nr:uncharacterized protein C1orf131 homolog [Patiria miniata]XP_038053237.1 uncharacterized protein C1orf131 homolog [Patiria miniata]